MQLKGIGAEFATVLYLEGLFRQFEGGITGPRPDSYGRYVLKGNPGNLVAGWREARDVAAH
jgi:hypothetical protein